MRTVIFLIGGLVLYAACIGGARLTSPGVPSAATVATVAFLFMWLAIAAFNMWFGVSKAGYSVPEEFPIFALIFGLPAVVGCLTTWLFL